MMRIVDSAVRLTSRGGKLPVESYLERMDRLGILHAVAAPADEFVAVYNDEGNAEMAKWVQSFPDHVSALAVANPWYGPKAVDILQRAFDQGCVGLYLHPFRQGFRLTEAIVDPLVEVCIQRDKGIYSHTGTPICAMPFQLAELARRFPEGRFVMGHFGYTDFAGYDVLPAARQVPNVSIDTSCAWGELVQQAIDALDPPRILFGSGYPRSSPRLEIDKMRRLDLRPDVLQKVMCDNALKFWGIRL